MKTPVIITIGHTDILLPDDVAAAKLVSVLAKGVVGFYHRRYGKEKSEFQVRAPARPELHYPGQLNITPYESSQDEDGQAAAEGCAHICRQIGIKPLALPPGR